MFWTVTRTLAEAFGTSMQLFALTLLFSLPLGLIISFGSTAKIKVIRWLVRTFVWIIRGTPLVLQLIIIFYGPGLVGGWAEKSEYTNAFIQWLATWHNFERFAAALIAFVINYSCYFSEIYRGGIASISKGQYEACHVLGMSKTQAFFKVVLLQVIKRIIPPMSNEIITLVKDTSLARVIGIFELTWSGESLIKSGLLWPLFYTGVFYLVACGVLTIIFNRAEKKLSFFTV